MELGHWKTKIESFASLPPRWDSYGAQPIKPASIAAALAFVSLVEKVPIWPSPVTDPHISPGPRGTIGMDWSTGPRELYLSFNGSRMSYLAVEEKCQFEEENEVHDMGGLLGWLKWRS